MRKLNDKNEVKVKFVYKDLEDKIAIESVWASKEGSYYVSLR